MQAVFNHERDRDIDLSSSQMNSLSQQGNGKPILLQSLATSSLRIVFQRRHDVIVRWRRT